MAVKTTRKYLFYLLLSNLCISTISLPVKRATKGGILGELFEGDIRIADNTIADNTKVEKRDTMMMVQDMPFEGSGMEDAVNMDKIAGNLWPDNIVYYRYDHDLSDYLRSLFVDAINAWSEATCLEFKNLDMEEKPQKAYLNFTSKLSCSSYVGRIGRMQEVSITSECGRFGHTAHEVGHAIGLFHEHTRSDRDQYIRIEWDNIKDERYKNNFKLYPHHNATRNIEYDFQSVMHYPLDAFAKQGGRDTIVVQDSIRLPECISKIGQRESLSYKDKLRVNKIYNCVDKIAELEKRGDDCPLSQTTTPTVATPATQKPTPACKPVKTIATDDLISLTLIDEKGKDNLACTSEGCLRKHCSEYDWNCRRSTVFRIYMTKNRKNNLIKNGYTIALRDTYRNQWMDCSRQDGCRLTSCADSPVEEITNYTNQICSVHHLKLFAVGGDKRIRTTDAFYIASTDKSLVLNCYGKQCKLVKEGSNDCSNSDESSGSSSGSECIKTIFRIQRHTERCE